MTARTTLLAVLLAAPIARADDWPQWMGPTRDNVWHETGILDTLPAGGPKKLWSVPVAGGYAGPAVADGKVFVPDYVSQNRTQAQLDSGNFDRKGSTGTERVFAFDAKTGKEIWKYEYPVSYTVSYPSGPRCTPTVHAGKVYALGSEGHLACLDAATGKKVWAKELKDEYKTKSALWGYAAHPLIDGNNLITLVGGEGSHVVAFNKDTGAEVWKSQSQPEQGYSPPLIIEAAGVRQMIVPGPKAVYALDPATGKRLWTTPYDATSGSIIMTPIRSGEYVLVAGYSDKNLLLKLTSDKPGVEVVFRDKKKHAVSPVNVQPMLDGGVVYGVDQSGELHAVELPTGKRLWTSTGPMNPDKAEGSGTAFIYKQGDRHIFFNEQGELVFGKLTPTGYTETSRATILEKTNKAFGRPVVWCAPAFADKKMYVRNDKELVCVDLAK